MKIIGLLMLILFPLAHALDAEEKAGENLPAQAGLHEVVDLLQFTPFETGYVLVVAPDKTANNQFMKDCQVFTVLGHYRQKSLFETFPLVVGLEGKSWKGHGRVVFGKGRGVVVT